MYVLLASRPIYRSLHGSYLVERLDESHAGRSLLVTTTGPTTLLTHLGRPCLRAIDQHEGILHRQPRHQQRRKFDTSICFCTQQRGLWNAAIAWCA